MNPLAIIEKLTGSLGGTVNNIIDKMPPKRVKSIKQGFLFFVVVCAAVGAFLGHMMGKDAAGIQIPPLAESIRDVFEYDINKERRGRFDSLIDSEMLTGQQSAEAQKIPFQAKDPFEMEYDGGIVDYKRDKPVAPDMEMNNTPMDGGYASPMGRPEGQVKPLNKTLDPENSAASPGPAIPDSRVKSADVPAAEKITPGKETKQGKTDIEPLKDNTGIMER
ncbi:MAG: hypothetical protein LBT84_06460 [Spirochaetia bacterium]|jgi:hypothetical protein|nr:hypothetical protein [Spirochaetia bacterium]